MINEQTPRATEQTKKEIYKIFRQHDLKVTIEANKKVVDFLDVTLNLNDNSFKPYNKPNNTPQYVHAKSNHPPCIIKNIPTAINKRLSEISSNEEVFNKAIPPYQLALNNSGYNYKLNYNPPEKQNKKRRRSRQIIWYNPPFDLSVKTNVGKQFLKILKNSFPKSNNLSKIFNKNTVKLRYSCMPSMKNIIDNNNKTVKEADQKPNSKTCNCRNPEKCPLHGNCLEKSVIYQAKVTSKNEMETYVGLTETEFKTRYNNHKTSFNTPSKKNATELSKHIWKLKESNLEYNIEWSIIGKAKPYSNTNKRCSLCIQEKFIIICKPNLATLNRRNELISTCRHNNKFLLKNVQKQQKTPPEHNPRNPKAHSQNATRRSNKNSGGRKKHAVT